MSGRRVLVTGFGPFEDVSFNPSAALARRLGALPGVHALELPVSFRRSLELLARQLEAHAAPAAIFSLGVHPGASFRLEAIARGARSERPDIDGVLAADLGSVTCAARAARADLGVLCRALERAGAPEVELSEDAGGYLCDHVYAFTLEAAERLNIPAVFLHVPPAETLSVHAQAPIVEAALHALVESSGARRGVFRNHVV